MMTTAHTDAARIDGERSRTISWTDPARVRMQLRGLDGYERLAAIQRGDAAPPPAAALLGISLDELERGRTVFSIVADELHENPMGTMHGGIIATLVDTAMGCAVSSTLPADAKMPKAPSAPAMIVPWTPLLMMMSLLLPL